MIIKIFGNKGEGKTTIAQFIEKALSEYGIEVKSEDTDSPELPLEERMKILGGDKGPLKIELKTIPYRRETRPQYAKEFSEHND